MIEPRIIHGSPWLYGLNRNREAISLRGTLKGDIAIIGGGIAGVASAYFLLTRTDRNIVLIEKNRIADGASGNNAGTATPIFERPLDDFIGIFGPDRVRGALKAVNDSWELLHELYAFAIGMDPPPAVNAYIGYRTKDEVAPVLTENALRVSLDSTPREVFFSEEKKSRLDGPLLQMPGLTFVPSPELTRHLRTNDPRFIAAVSDQEVLINSAEVCEMTVQKLRESYPQRFQVFENTEVRKIVLDDDTRVTVVTKEGEIVTEYAVLATNGFEQFELAGSRGEDIHVRYHKNVTSRLAYMLGVFIEKEPVPYSVAYVHEPDAHDPGISYEYVTERAYTLDGKQGALLSIGGPDSEFNHERADYHRDVPFRRGVEKEMERFLEIHFGLRLKDTVRFRWHGLMGYTETYARLVGKDPNATRLLYNVGCNGVGILLSLWGGARLADVLLGETLAPTMFDPESHFDAKALDMP